MTLLANQLKISAANPGRVAVFFPANEETSELRFHLHAPFVPVLSRASIKETPANDPLFKQLAELTAGSLHSIRELNLLTGEFLEVLPNLQDVIPPRYEPIRSAIIAEMNNEPLTPTYSKSHAPAKNLLQAEPPLKHLLTIDDIKFLVKDDKQWAIAAPQKNSYADRFLTGLAITEWDMDKFVKLLADNTAEGFHIVLSPFHAAKGPDEEFMRWLAKKPVEWHQELYALLYRELEPERDLYRLKDLQLIRLSDGGYSVGSKCFFPSDGIEQDEVLPRVDAGIYSSGRSKPQQERARKLLEEVGVREVGEAEQVEVILKQRYTGENINPDPKDLGRFVALVQKAPDRAPLFAEYFIFERKDGKWGKPNQVYLDSPYRDTRLRPYYEALGEEADKVALADRYEACGISAASIAKFAEEVGVCWRLEIERQEVYSKHPQWDKLGRYWAPRVKPLIDEDWTIEHLEKVLARPSEELSRLLWNTMSSTEPRVLKARLCRRGYPEREGDSSLVLLLKEKAWIPQGRGEFVVPREASRTRLPKGFPYDEGYEWLKAIGFGEEEQQHSDEYRKKQSAAKELDFTFNDPASLERAKRFNALPPDEQENILAEQERRAHPELPGRESSNPERRAERVAEQAGDAPERLTEERTRSVSIGLEEVKQKAAQYLRDQYTNSDGEMICQVCKENEPLPFKLDDGTYYFEKVEFLRDLKKRHYQNYLALCPNHAAMFQHANSSTDLMQNMFIELAGNELEVVLAQTDMTIYFTKTHIADLKTVIETDQRE